MLFFFFGENYEQKNKKVKAILKAIKTKKPDANFFHYDSFDITEEKLKELLKSQGLFEEKNIVLLTNIFLNLELKK
jgi:DNA polymerase III delta subunit